MVVYNKRNFGNICIQNNDYTTAKRAFKSVIEKGEESLYFMRGQNSLLNVSFLEITTRRDFTSEELNVTIQDYKNVLEKYQFSRVSLPIILELAHIEAFYGGEGTDAISLLQKAMEINNLTDVEKAEVKMKLADIHVLHGDIWEASLLYMQVDSDFKYETIGHEAKFKNARIFFMMGNLTLLNRSLMF